MKVIELTGIPGSGKSTILPVLKRYFQKIGIQTFDSSDIITCCDYFPFKIKLFKRFLSSLPNRLHSSLIIKLNNGLKLRHKYQLKYSSSNSEFFDYVVRLTELRPINAYHKNLTIGFFLRTAGDYQIAYDCLGKDSIFILDEGFVHRVVTLFVSLEEKEVDFGMIQRYLERIPKADALIKVEANEQLCKKRLMNRELPHRLQRRTEYEILEYLARSKSVIEYAMNFLIIKGISTVTLHNSDEQFFQQNIINQIAHNFG